MTQLSLCLSLINSALGILLSALVLLSRRAK